MRGGAYSQSIISRIKTLTMISTVVIILFGIGAIVFYAVVKNS